MYPYRKHKARAKKQSEGSYAVTAQMMITRALVKLGGTTR